MDSFLSGFSRSYGSAQVGNTGYTGSVSQSAANSTQGVDITQLQPGDSFQGEIVSVNGEDVQIELTNGQYMAAKLERDVQVALGQILTLQVQSNKDNKVVLKPVYDQNLQMLRVGEAALRAAHLSVNDKTLALVSKLLENGMSIDRKTLMEFNRLSLQNPQAEITDLIKLNKLHLPATDNNLTQLHNYQNMEYKLLDGIKEASDEIQMVYEALAGNQSAQGTTQAALENAGKFMEQVLTLLTGKENQNQEIPQSVSDNHEQNPSGITEENHAENTTVLEETTVKEKNLTPGNTEMPKQHDTISQKQANSSLDTAQHVERENKAELFARLKSENPSALPDKLTAFIKDGKFDMKDVKQLLMDTEIGKMLTTEQKAKIFHSEPFQSMIRNGLQKHWTLAPQELVQNEKVDAFYQKLLRESSQLSRMMEEALQGGSTQTSAAHPRAAANISENIEFMNQVNQMFHYVQLPLKLSNSQAHGDLYVYTNKKNMARRDGMLTAFLHLDMDNLGSLDVSIALQTERSQVTTKFYLDEGSMKLVEGHIGELAQRLSKKGYQCKSMILEKEENRTVLDHIEEQTAGQSAVLSYQTFDTRA